MSGTRPRTTKRLTGTEPLLLCDASDGGRPLESARPAVRRQPQSKAEADKTSPYGQTSTVRKIQAMATYTTWMLLVSSTHVLTLIVYIQLTLRKLQFGLPVACSGAEASCATYAADAAATDTAVGSLPCALAPVCPALGSAALLACSAPAGEGCTRIATVSVDVHAYEQSASPKVSSLEVRIYSAGTARPHKL